MEKLVQSFYNWYQKTLEHPQYRWVLVGATLLYLLSPIDIAPDVIPILGWIDDGIVASILVASLSQMLLAGRNRRRQHLKTDPVDVTPTVDVNVE
ncbi:MAG: YkvA family protein [Cyanobacteriota bacterium]|nr:YkvA family protein [Cyanobacteriota bacterium]